MITLAEIRAAHDALQSMDVSQTLSQTLEDDEAWCADGPTVVVCGKTVTSGEQLARNMARAMPELKSYVLAPHRSRSRWTGDELIVIERALALLVETSAQQLLPRPLADLLGSAARAGVPTAVIVTRMGRVSDPQGIAERAPEIFVPLLGRGPWVIECVGDSRFDGPTFFEAVESACSSFAPWKEAIEDWSSRLAAARRSRLLEWVSERRGSIAEFQSSLKLHSVLVQESFTGLAVLARATASHSASAFGSVAAEVGKLDPNEISRLTLEENPDEAGLVLKRFTGLIIDELRAAISRGCQSSEKIITSELEQLDRNISEDVRSLQRDLLALVEAEHGRETGLFSDTSGTGLNLDLNFARDTIVRELLECVVVEDALLELFDSVPNSIEQILTAPSSSTRGKRVGEAIPTSPERREDDRDKTINTVSRSKVADEVSPTNQETGESGNENLNNRKKDEQDDPIEDSESRAQRFIRWYTMARKTKLPSLLTAEAERILSEVIARLPEVQKKIANRWTEVLVECVESRAEPLTLVVSEARATIRNRSEALDRAYAAINK